MECLLRGGDYFLSNPKGLAFPVHRRSDFLCMVQIKKIINMISDSLSADRAGVIWEFGVGE